MNLLNKMICEVILCGMLFCCATIIHEMGHIIFGKIMNFTFFYVEIFGFRISVKNKKINFKIFPKINAKTFMYPKGIKFILARTIVYYMGGVVFSSIIFCLSIFFLPSRNIKLVFEIMLFISIIIAMLCKKGTDLDNLRLLYHKDTRIYILVQFFLMNEITPQNMPDKWFELIKEKPYDMENLYLHKMRYYRMLENSENIKEFCYQKIIYMARIQILLVVDTKLFQKIQELLKWKII